LKILGEPDLSIVSFGADEFDVFRVAELMSEKGWLSGLVQKPRGIHRMMSMFHEPVLDEYLNDLRAAIGVVRQAPPSEAAVRATY
jgi:sphinganine-1-phosphate aldolase